MPRCRATATSRCLCCSSIRSAPRRRRRRVAHRPQAQPLDGRIRMALVGAGGFAQGMHLPNLQKLDVTDIELRAVVSRTG